MTISILICTLPERKHFLDRLLAKLKPQVEMYPLDVEILIDSTGRHMPTGTKRNLLKDICNGKYFGFIDCDDMITDDYVSQLMVASLTNPDVITFAGNMTTDGRQKVDWVIKLGEKYEARTDSDGVERYYRFPNHLTFMKKELVADVRFQDIWQGEDYAYALEVKFKDALKTDYHIDKQIYFYEFRSRK